MWTRSSGITLPVIERGGLLKVLIICFGLLGSSAAARAQELPAQPPPPPGAQNQTKDSRIRRDVDLVLLHATVVDQKGIYIPNLQTDNFRVFENNIEQKVSVFKNEDIPVTMGLVIDNSGSMRDKRPRVNAAALTFVQTSNPQDQAFVVNFNDEYFLDLDEDFTSDQKELKAALDRIDSRGSTALYDALVGSLDHLKKGNRDKKVLLVITDGEDNASRKDLAYAVQAAQQSNAVIYAVGLFSDDDKKERRRATKALIELTEATGGKAYFPKDVSEVDALCTQIAAEIRHQYTLGYYPTNTARDGSYRTVRVEVIPPRGGGKLYARTRPGYYAQHGSASASN
ncbi:MAG: VWA domain-containing protein [Candidatus Acidiferrales bacterium]